MALNFRQVSEPVRAHRYLPPVEKSGSPLLCRVAASVLMGRERTYMLQAPFCLMLTLSALLVPRRLRGVSLLLLLALTLPRFAEVTRLEAARFSEAGAATAAVVGAIHRAIPVNDGYPHIIDNVPEMHHGYVMMGYFFEIAVADS